MLQVWELAMDPIREDASGSDTIPVTRAVWPCHRLLHSRSCIFSTGMLSLLQIHCCTTKCSNACAGAAGGTFSGRPMQGSQAVLVTEVDGGDSSRQRQQLRHQRLHLALQPPCVLSTIFLMVMLSGNSFVGLLPTSELLVQGPQQQCCQQQPDTI